jgi:hypothetical protein
MHPRVEVVHEGKRGCGYRKVGGMYLRGSGFSYDCGRIPIPLMTCPCCGHGFKPARGWTWVDGDRLLEAAPDCLKPKKYCRRCPLQQLLDDGAGKCGLIWVGEVYYPTTADFDREAEELGLSRRITTVPHDFQVNKTWVLLAHRKAIQKEETAMGKPPEFIPGIFRIFRPTSVEIVVSGDEPDTVIEDYLKRGLTPVKVIREGEPGKQEALMPGSQDDDA